MSIAEKLTTVAENVPKVYQAGKQAEYDAFWDSYQSTSIYPNRCGPAHFAGAGWNNDTFKPKYDIKVLNGYFLFYNCNVRGDLVEILNELGVSLDTSKMRNAFYLFSNSHFSRVGEINFRNMNHPSFTTNAFSTPTLITIDKLIVAESATFHSSTFTSATGLKNITIEGPIADSINFKDSPLTKASITSVINALSSTATGLTATFKKSAKEAAFTADEWATLIATKPNWTISLV